MGVQVKKMEARQVTEGSDRVTCRAPSWFEIYRTWSRDTISDHVRSLETVWYTFATFQVHYNRCLPINPPLVNTHTPIPLEAPSLSFVSIFKKLQCNNLKILQPNVSFQSIDFSIVKNIDRAYHVASRFLGDTKLALYLIWVYLQLAIVLVLRRIDMRCPAELLLNLHLF